MPLLLGPTGLQRLVHRRADLEVAQAAGAAGIPFVVSASTAFTVEQIADAGSGDLWLQVYPWRDRKALERVIARAQGGGILDPGGHRRCTAAGPPASATSATG